MPIAKIESLDHEGHGVAHVDGKTIFIDGALTGETIEYSSYRKKPSFENAQSIRVLKASSQRVNPKCQHFGVCGGCSMQHLEPSAQVAAKQRVLEDNLRHIGKVKAERILPAIYGPSWGYRHRARLSARMVEKKGGMLVGFHEKRSSFIADMTKCEILPPHVSALLVPLRGLIASLSISRRMPQIELAVGDNVTALVLRNMDPITEEDEQKLAEFAAAHSKPHPIQFWLQPKGPDTVFPLVPADAPRLTYSMPEFAIEMPYKPTEFTQVNPQINQVMVRRAIDLLDPQPGESIADMFCGLGNFTLPIARRGAQVLGMEGSKQLCERAVENATHNGLQDKTKFTEANLFEMTEEGFAGLGDFDRMLIDPPRDGAMELVKSIGLALKRRPDALKRIVYVSCNPATLARDASVLVNVHGYKLNAAGIINMFPHTAHVESIAWFERDPHFVPKTAEELAAQTSEAAE